MGDTYKNTIRDEARVDIVVGKVHGDVNHGHVPARASSDIKELLEEIRTELASARQRGEIDTASAEAAVEELDKAADTLPATDEESQGKLITSLKKAKGLVEGLAGLTEKVATAITAVHGLQ